MRRKEHGSKTARLAAYVSLKQNGSTSCLLLPWAVWPVSCRSKSRSEHLQSLKFFESSRNWVPIWKKLIWKWFLRLTFWKGEATERVLRETCIYLEHQQVMPWCCIWASEPDVESTSSSAICGKADEVEISEDDADLGRIEAVIGTRSRNPVPRNPEANQKKAD